MAQVSYGTITITDTNDIESIIVEYARNQSTSSAPTSGWSTTRPTWAQGYYIWQRTRTHKAGTSTDSDIYGTAVCITGSTGQTGGTGAAGRSLTSTVTQYTTATNSATITQSNMGSYTWNSNVPSYSSSTPAYWVRVTNTYSNPSSTEYIIYKDNGLTDAITKSVEANNNAAIANSIAQHANENAQGAISQAAETQYQTEALAAKVKNYWWDSTGAHIASGINGADVTEGTASTYGFNSLVGLASMTFGYNSYKTVELDGSIPALKFYKPSKTAQGDLTATLNSNGLTLSEGGVKAGTAGQSGFIYLSTKNYGSNLTINSHTASNWREIIGTKFGVDADGNLYASNASIEGAITATSLTIGSGNNAYSGIDAINITGYSIEITETDIVGSTNSKKLIPHLYHNGINIDTEVTDWTKFIWYRDTESTGITGSSTDGSITGYYGSTYKVTYGFEEGTVGGGTEITTITVQPTDYITDINNTGIKIHPKNHDSGNYIQLDGTGMEVFKIGGTDVSIAVFGANGARIGALTNGHTIIQASGMKVYANDGTIELANIGYGSGNNQSGGTSNAPYYTFGRRQSGSAVGNYSVAEGVDTTASGAGSHAEGASYVGITASGMGSHAEGYSGYYTITASGVGSHAEGAANYGNTEASGEGSHAEGSRTTAIGFASHAEGNHTIAEGNNSHAEGRDAHAIGTASHASGIGTIAEGNWQTVLGCYNIADTTSAFIIGNGGADNRKNAFIVDKNGDVRIKGDVYVGCNEDSSGGSKIICDTQTQTLTALGKSWYFARIGRVVYIDAPNDTTANVSAGNNTIGTLNAGLRPTAIQYLKCTNVNADVRLVINTNGTVQLYSTSAWTGAHNCGVSGYCYLAST